LRWVLVVDVPGIPGKSTSQELLVAVVARVLLKVEWMLPNGRTFLLAVLSSSLVCLAGASAAVTVVDADFDGGTDGFSYQDDTFRGTGEPGYASGAHLASGGLSGGGLRVTLGGIDGADINGMSGGWQVPFNLASAVDLQLSFQYNLSLTPEYESNEYGQVMVSLDGALLAGAGPDYVMQLNGDGNGGSPTTSGWLLFSTSLGTLSAGPHTLVFGGYNNLKTYADESTEVLIDDVLVGDPPPPNPAPQALVDALDFQKYKDNIQKLSRRDPNPPPGDPDIGGSRHWTQPGNMEAVDWIKAQLELYGYADVQLHPYTYQTQTRHNVYATKIGTTHPEAMYIVSAHLDSKTTDGSGNDKAAGADDNASGTSLVLEVARVFAASEVETEYSIRFAFWNNEETGLIGSGAYVDDFRLDQGVEDPPGSGQYPEPTWRGMIQHDMILWDHGLPYIPGAPQNPDADIDIEYNASETFGGAAIALANALLAGNVTYATDYPAEVSDQMSNTDSARFEDWTAAVSLRENRRLLELGSGSNPFYHTSTDIFENYSDVDYLFGFNTVQTTVGAVAELAGASLTTTCGDGTPDPGEDCDDGNTDPGDCCSPTCSFESDTTECRAAADVCDVAETCTGSSGMCPSDGYQPPETECRAATGVCDIAEMCTGATASCPGDAKLAGECRASAGDCDIAEVCDGVSDDCPLDGYAPAMTECRASTGVCDPAESCTGSGADCPADQVLDGAPCPDSDVCNGAEQCVTGVCTSGGPLDCDDGHGCTADSCDEIEGCVHTPIEPCSEVPTTSEWGLILMILVMTAAGALRLEQRRRFQA
jgi:cysteine-rich repeat protein